jgi:glutamate N-acetyltransferase/amino-acid N-acetyltransferase
VYTGIRAYGDEPRFDLGLLVSDRPCSLAGVFTKNKVCGAPILLNRERVRLGSARALIVNSGCSNVAMGERGDRDAAQMAQLAANQLGIAPADVLVGSTGVIGRALPMDKIAQGVGRIQPSRDGGAAFSRAIMTTDTRPKTRAVRFKHAGVEYTVAGTAKGSGMVHPDMATVFCFITTDAGAESGWLSAALQRVADATINMVDVDMDTSTSDMMLAFANGAASERRLSDDTRGAEFLEGAMLLVATELAKDLARDGEGATTMIEATVRGAASMTDARRAARAVVSSPLVKSMVTGKDPNLGRVLMALGRSGADLQVERLGVWIGEYQAFAAGVPTELDLTAISQAMSGDCVRLEADLGLGPHAATAWGCNLTEDYVKINAHYTT